LDYKAPWPLKNGHVNTLHTALLRKVEQLPYSRERITLKDGDFIDLDWVTNGSKKLVVLSHGLEGDSRGTYIQGMMKKFLSEGYDGLAWNCRGCSGEVNLKPFYYNSGVSHDLDEVLSHVIESNSYDEIFLIGFSMGGNISLKYLGEKGTSVPEKIKGAAIFSTPVDLRGCSFKLDEGFCKVYTQNFLKTLKQKVKLKEKQILEAGFKPRDIYKCNNLNDFDNIFTGPLHGYKDAEDYYTRASSKQFIGSIEVPTLLVNASDDPFLTESCYPHEILNKNFTFERPEYGGHVGFGNLKSYQTIWSEDRAFRFISNII